MGCDSLGWKGPPPPPEIIPLHLRTEDPGVRQEWLLPSGQPARFSEHWSSACVFSALR